MDISLALLRSAGTLTDNIFTRTPNLPANKTPFLPTVVYVPAKFTGISYCSSLLTVLFPEKPFRSLAELLHTFSAVDLRNNSASKTPAPGGDETSDQGVAVTTTVPGTGQGESLVWHVTNIATRFASLMEVIVPPPD